MFFASVDVLGVSLVLSENSVRKSFIPPTFIAGRTAIAMMMNPIPPIHCRIERQRRTDLGMDSTSGITDAPIVVSPDMVSNTAPVKSRLVRSQIGIAPNRQPRIQTELVRMNMSLIEREKCFGFTECVSTKATDSVITNEAKNLERPSLAVKKQ